MQEDPVVRLGSQSAHMPGNGARRVLLVLEEREWRPQSCRQRGDAACACRAHAGVSECAS